MQSIGRRKPRRRRSFTAKFKAEIVELCQRGDRSAGRVAKDFDPTESAVREWVKQAGRDAGTRQDGGLTRAERQERRAAAGSGRSWCPCRARPRGPILRNTRRTRMDRHAATRRLRRLADIAGVQVTRAHPHMLRHTFRTTMLDAGVDLRDAQIAARHADPRTTMRNNRPART
jgi:transposase-like protein